MSRSMPSCTILILDLSDFFHFLATFSTLYRILKSEEFDSESALPAKSDRSKVGKKPD